MVVLSAAILSKSKTLIARQFVEMTRLRIEGLLSAFPKLVDSGKDHTYIETESVRYVYQPMESLFLVLITNKASNILEDLETLRLLAKVVQDCCHIQVNEELLLKHAFDVIFAFDEVISFGHRESVTLSQIKTYCEMDSHEEKLHQMIEQSKINEAKEAAKKKAFELAKNRMSQKADNSSMGGGGGGGSGGGSSVEDQLKALQMSSPGPSMGDSSGGGSAPPWGSSMSMGDDSGSAPIRSAMPKRGMALGKKPPAGMMAFGGDPAEAAMPGEPAKVEEAAAPAPAAVNPLLDPVTVTIDEKISANLQMEGGIVGEAECLGQFVVNVLDTAKADLVCFKLAEKDARFKFKVHPNLNKASEANNILEIRDPSRAYRANTPAPLLKWRYTSSKDEFLPITLSCWPSSTADGTAVVLEYELTDTNVCLQDIHVRFPCPPNAKPQIGQPDSGEAAYDPNSQQVHWYIPSIDKDEASGTFEFTASTDMSMMLPFTFDGVVQGRTVCPMQITECYHQARNEPIAYSAQVSTTYSFTIGA